MVLPDACRPFAKKAIAMIRAEADKWEVKSVGPKVSGERRLSHIMIYQNLRTIANELEKEWGLGR